MRLRSESAIIGGITAISIFAAAGCNRSAPQSFAASVRSASGATLYEGLPHPMFEKQALQQELDSKPTVQHHGYPFYAEPLPITAADEQALRDLVCAADTFSAFVAERKCGGFHPDYCIEWRGRDGSPYRALICFGCHEAKLSGPAQEVRFDIRAPAYDLLQTILAAYGRNRPARTP